MAYEPSFERTDLIDALCMEIAELVGMLSPQAPLSTSPTLRRELRIQTIYSSLVIEGNKLDERAVSAIIDGKRVLGDRRDILEVENARAAYDLIPELDPHSLEDLLRVHRVMMGGLVPDAGRFRSGNVGVFNGDALIHAGTPAAYVPEVMGSLFEWLRTTRLHPLLASCIFHFEFEFCHPFSDGNGRTGRLWHTLLLSRWRPVLAWVPIESAIRRRQADYYEALARSGATGSWSLCSKQSGKPYVRTRGQRVQRTRSAPARSLSFGITRSPPSLSSRNILGARSGAPSAQSHSSKKKASSSVGGVPVRACGLSVRRDSKLHQ